MNKALLLWTLLLALPLYAAEPTEKGRCSAFAELGAEESRLFRGIDLVEAPRGHGSPVSTAENRMKRDVEEKILPFIAKGKEGEFTGVDGVPVRYRRFDVPDPKGAIVISHGRGETLGFYLETIRNLSDWGYTVYFMEHRGHGNSGRMLENPHKVHVEKFDDYVKDLQTFMDTVVAPEGHDRTVMLGHSMGGLIASLYDARNPGKLDKLVLVTPMFRPKLKGIPEPVARGIMSAVNLLGLQDAYALGEKDFQYSLRPTSPRREWLEDVVNRREYRAGEMGGSTYRWVGEALKAGSEGRKLASRMTTPTLVLAAGNDAMIDNKAIFNFCRAHAACKMQYLPQSDHALLLERDSVRNPAMGAIREFIDP